MPDTKIVTIDNRTYVVSKFTAKTGSYIFMLTMKTLAKLSRENAGEASSEIDAPMSDPETAANNAIRLLIMNADEAAFTRIQREALTVVSREEWVNNVSHPLPVLTYNGAFAIAELEYDTTTVLALTHQALFYNLAPYFQKKELLQLALGNMDTKE